MKNNKKARKILKYIKRRILIRIDIVENLNITDSHEKEFYRGELFGFDVSLEILESELRGLKKKSR